MSNKKLIIISIDALNAQDFDTIKDLSVFREFIQHGAYVRQVSSVYPSVTYTCHTSIATGQYPANHQIYNNEIAQPHQATTQDWHWFDRDIKRPSLFDYARQNNLSVATLLWPVMGDADVQWNVPEIWSPNKTVSGFSLFLRHGTKSMLYPVLRYSRLLKGTEQPYLDNFTHALAKHTLRYKKPDITAIHYTELDAVRHQRGLHSSEAQQVLIDINQRLSDLISTTKSAGTYEKTNFILLGDHGTHDFQYVISINRYLMDLGFISTDTEGTITHWQAYGCSSGGSCQIHLAKECDNKMRDAIHQALSQLTASANSPIKSLMTKEDASETYQLSGDFQWVLEAENPYVFRNDIMESFLTASKDIPNCYIGDHGYLPDHPDMKTMLFMMGPNIVKASSMAHCSLVDEGPTFARLMGLEMEKTDGVVLDSLITV